VFLIAAGAAGASAASFGLSAVMAPTGPRRNRAVGAKTSAFSALEERWTMGSVIFFIHDLSLTGVADNTLGLARHLAKASWDVDIVTAAATWIERGGTLSVTPLRPGCSGSRTATLRNVLPSLRRHLRRRRPEIVFSAGNHAHLGCWTATRGLV
jgi:hypothetical protein